MGRRVVAPLIVGDRGIAGRRFRHGFQRQRTAGVLKENTRALERAGVHMREVGPNGGDQGGGVLDHGMSCQGRKQLELGLMADMRV